MGKIAVVTDSTADLPAPVREKYDIKMVPLQVHLAGEDYRDWVDIEPEDFLARMKTASELPTTSQPPVGRFVELYRSLAENYRRVVSIHLPEALSGTVESARLAADMVDEIDIEVIDSGKVTGALGEMVVRIAQRVESDGEVEEIKSLVEELKDRIKLYFTLDSLDYLEAGGRIGKASAFLGNLFNVRPVLTLAAGEVVPCKKVRGEKRLYKDLDRLVAKQLEAKGGESLVILHGTEREKADKLKEVLTANYSWSEVKIRSFGPVIASHVGYNPFGAVVVN